MELNITQYKHCDLIKPDGRVDSSTAPLLADALEKITGHGHFKIILDLEKVDFMSSAGLRVMINTQKKCRRYNRGELALASVPKNIHSALDLAGFIPLFRIFEDVIQAVGSF